MILDVLLDSLVDTCKLLPILFFTYLLMEYLEHHAGGKVNGLLQRARYTGPFWGALLGLLPQCGFSGAAANLYAAGTVTAGTLLAVFLATSDEMLPILLSSGFPLLSVALILGLKFLSAVGVGFLMDWILHSRNRKHREIHDFCAQEHCSCEGGIFRSALRHTVKIIALIFLVTLALNLAFAFFPQDRIAALWNIPMVGEVLAACLGLFPNCAASVTITNLYVQGVMGPGPMLSGLLVNAGVGLLVLFRVSKNKRENFLLVGVLMLSGTALGYIFGALFAGIL